MLNFRVFNKWQILLPTLLFGVLAAVASAGTRPAVKWASFSDLKGQTHSAASLEAHKATVFVFLSTQCPVSKVYGPRLNTLAKYYADQNVQTLGVFANVQESQPEISTFVKARNLAFPIVRDTNAAIAQSLGATMTPEAIVVSSQGTTLYRGRIDDSADTSLVKRHDLQDALTAIVADKPVLHARTAAFGCIIRRPAAVQTASAQITYCKNVAPILNQNCVQCHRSGEIGPMPLTTYAQAAAWRGDIAKYAQNKQMPPWKADPHAGDFLGARRLTDTQIATLVTWNKEGAPEGNPRDLPPAPQFNADGWPLGQPDLVLEPPRPYHLAADGADVFRCFVLPTNFTENRWVRAVEVRPGCRAVVHHVIAYIDGNGASANLDDKETEPGYSSFGGVGFTPTDALAGWAPGIAGHFLPDGVATFVPAGARIVLQVHYHKDGKPETDHTQLGIYFANTPVQKRLRILPLYSHLHILPGDSHYVTTMTLPSPVDAHLVAITPHMHLLGRAINVTATLPDGKKEPLVNVPNWDYNWQATYYYKQPVALPRGTQLTLTAQYDNSVKNPRNPNKPPKLVGWGEQTTDEMCLAFLHFTVDQEKLAPRTAQR